MNSTFNPDSTTYSSIVSLYVLARTVRVFNISPPLSFFFFLVRENRKRRWGCSFSLFFILYALVSCLHVCLGEDVRSWSYRQLEAAVTDSCELPCGCWELNLVLWRALISTWFNFKTVIFFLKSFRPQSLKFSLQPCTHPGKLISLLFWPWRSKILTI